MKHLAFALAMLASTSAFAFSGRTGEVLESHSAVLPNGYHADIASAGGVAWGSGTGGIDVTGVLVTVTYTGKDYQTYGRNGVLVFAPGSTTSGNYVFRNTHAYVGGVSSDSIDYSVPFSNLVTTYPVGHAGIDQAVNVSFTLNISGLIIPVTLRGE
jgi:hypothetical protein